MRLTEVYSSERILDSLPLWRAPEMKCPKCQFENQADAKF